MFTGLFLVSLIPHSPLRLKPLKRAGAAILNFFCYHRTPCMGTKYFESLVFLAPSFWRARYGHSPSSILRRKSSGCSRLIAILLTSIDGKLLDKQQELTGAYLMGAGIHLNLRGDFDSTAVLLERVQ